MTSSRGSFQSRDRTQVSCIAGRFFNSGATRDIYLYDINASLEAQMVKDPSVIWETWVRSLDWKYPLEKGMATHSSILVWRIPWTEEPGRLQSMGLQRVGHD